MRRRILEIAINIKNGAKGWILGIWGLGLRVRLRLWHSDGAFSFSLSVPSIKVSGFLAQGVFFKMVNGACAGNRRADGRA